MIGSNMPRYAILMGDLVHSEDVADRAALHARFNRAIDRANDVHGADLASPLTITLGDEFQGLAGSLTAAFEIARGIRMDLLDDAVECRFALGIETLQTPLNRERAWNMMGAGLTATRERLNEKLENRLYRFVFAEEPLLETLLEACGASLTAIERRWTAVQRHDVRALLDGRTPAAIARSRDVSARAVYKTRSSANFDLYRLQLQAIGQTLAALDQRCALGGGTA